MRFIVNFDNVYRVMYNINVGDKYMNRLTREMLNEIGYLKEHLKEVESVPEYCTKYVEIFEDANKKLNRDDYDYCYNLALIGLLESVKCHWLEYDSLICCISYLEDVEDWINSSDFEYEYNDD